MYGPTWPFLFTYGSHDMRHTGFHRLTVVNETLEIGASQSLLVFMVQSKSIPMFRHCLRRSMSNSPL